MKNLLTPASCLLLALLAVVALRTEAPAQAQTQQTPPGLEERVAKLESELKAEKAANAETRALLEQTLAYLERRGKAAEAVLSVLDESESQGFAVGENWKSRQTLLAGLRAFWGQAGSGLPKPPAPEPVAPAPVTRPVRR